MKIEFTSDDILDRAIVFATEMHSGETRKRGNIPYIYHPLEVMSIVATITPDREVLAAAVLHDTVEDTPATVEAIEHLFGKRVADIVANCSEDKREHRPATETWKVRKQETLDHLATCHDRDILAVVLGDKISNLRQTRRDLESDGEEIWLSFNVHDPKEHAWYYGSIANLLEEDMGDTFAWREYCYLVDKIFSRYGWEGTTARK